jgi:hypothetical protein
MTDTEFDAKFNYYEAVREELGLSAIWSIYEIGNLSDRHPYEGVKFLTYKDFFGKDITVEINGFVCCGKCGAQSVQNTSQFYRGL